MDCDEYYFCLHDELYHTVLSNIVNKRKLRLKTIKAHHYKQALTEFITYGVFVRFDVDLIQNWKTLVLTNYTYLSIITEICGHTSHIDLDAINDFFDTSFKSYDDFSTFFEQYDDYIPKFDNGHYMISDYAFTLLNPLIMDLMNNDDPIKLIVIIDKILQVYHQRSDLSQIFIQGGSQTLNEIHN